MKCKYCDKLYYRENGTLYCTVDFKTKYAVIICREYEEEDCPLKGEEYEI